jgi:hypothetical protein
VRAGAAAQAGLLRVRDIRCPLTEHRHSGWDGLSAAAEAEGGWAADPPIGRRGAAGRPGSMTSSRSWDGRSAGGTGRNS